MTWQPVSLTSWLKLSIFTTKSGFRSASGEAENIKESWILISLDIRDLNAVVDGGDEMHERLEDGWNTIFVVCWSTLLNLCSLHSKRSSSTIWKNCIDCIILRATPSFFLSNIPLLWITLSSLMCRVHWWWYSLCFQSYNFTDSTWNTGCVISWTRWSQVRGSHSTKLSTQA